MIVDLATYPLRNWLTCIDELHALGFSDAEIDAALAKADLWLTDLTEQRIFPLKHSSDLSFTEKSSITPCVVIRRGKLMQTIRHPLDSSYTKHDFAPGVELRVRSQYQGLKHGKLLHALLSNRFPWFGEFRWALHEIRSGENAWNECYMATTPPMREYAGKEFKHSPTTSLYVPLGALIQCDKEAIIQRHRSYHEDFYKGDDRAHYRHQALAVFEAPETIHFFKHLDGAPACVRLA